MRPMLSMTPIVVNQTLQVMSSTALSTKRLESRVQTVLATSGDLADIGSPNHKISRLFGIFMKIGIIFLNIWRQREVH
jgi:hypothetical protein